MTTDTVPMYLHEPNPAGYWLMPGSELNGQGIRFYVPRCPPWLHRYLMRVLLGFVWYEWTPPDGR